MKNIAYTLWKNYGLILIVSLALFLLPVIIRSDYYIHVLSLVLIYSFLAVAWNIQGGFAGLLSLGHVTFVGIGAYATAILGTQYGVSPWIGIVVGSVAAGIIALFIALISLRFKGAYYALGTIAFALIIRLWLIDTEKIFGVYLGAAKGIIIPFKNRGLAYLEFKSEVYYYLILVACNIAIILFTIFLRKGKLGHSFMAVRDNESAASALGVNVFKTKVLAALISGLLTGLGGGLYGQFIRFVDPFSMLDWSISIEVVVLSIVGGLGTIWGPLLGAFLLRPLALLVQILFGGGYAGLHLVLYGLILILSILYLPNGLVAALSSGYKKMKTLQRSQVIHIRDRRVL